jgi:hypothetical protein
MAKRAPMKTPKTVPKDMPMKGQVPMKGAAGKAGKMPKGMGMVAPPKRGKK